MTDRITLRYNGIEESIEVNEVTERDTSIALCGLPTDVDDDMSSSATADSDESADEMDYGLTTIDSEILDEAPGGRHGEYRGVSQSMADPRCEHNEQFPKIRIGDDSEIKIVEIEEDVE